MIIKLKFGVSGVFNVFLQHYMYQTWMCVLQIHSLFLRWKKTNYCKIQVSSLRRFAFATLRWPHCARPPTPLRQPGFATRLITVLAPLPAHSGCSDYMTTPITYCYIFRPPGKWFWTILHATSSLPARWTPLVERKPDSRESGITKYIPCMPHYNARSPQTNRKKVNL